MIRYFLLSFWLFSCLSFSQTPKDISWISVQQLADTLPKQPQKTLLYFYADWCVYCKKMEQHAFKSLAVIAHLQKEFYTAKMDVETTDTIYFGGKEFYSRQQATQRRPTHDFALLLGSRANEQFSLPVLLLLDENFNVVRRSFSYMTTEELLEFLNM